MIRASTPIFAGKLLSTLRMGSTSIGANLPRSMSTEICHCLIGSAQRTTQKCNQVLIHGNLLHLCCCSAISPEEKTAIRSRLLTALDEEQKPVSSWTSKAYNFCLEKKRQRGYLSYMC